jgi:inactivated superfamily I helicase
VWLARVFSEPRGEMNVLNPSDPAGHDIAVLTDELELPAMLPPAQRIVVDGSTNAAPLKM